MTRFLVALVPSGFVLVILGGMGLSWGACLCGAVACALAVYGMTGEWR